MPKRRSRALLPLLQAFRGFGTSDPMTNDKSLDPRNLRNLLTCHPIFTDPKKVPDADPLNIMMGLLLIKEKYSDDGPISLDIMMDLLHIKVKHTVDKSISCNMSARLHHQKICLFSMARGTSLAYKKSTMPPELILLSLKFSGQCSHPAPCSENFLNIVSN